MQRARSSWKANVALVLLWLNFVALWGRVYYITTRGDVTDSMNYLGALISAYGLVVAWWIFHNIRIYRAKGARSVRPVQHMNTHDSMRRYISRKTNLQRGQEILVDVIGDRKVFIEGHSWRDKEPALTNGSR